MSPLERLIEELSIPQDVLWPYIPIEEEGGE